MCWYVKHTHITHTEANTTKAFYHSSIKIEMWGEYTVVIFIGITCCFLTPSIHFRISRQHQTDLYTFRQYKMCGHHNRLRANKRPRHRPCWHKTFKLRRKRKVSMELGRIWTMWKTHIVNSNVNILNACCASFTRTLAHTHSLSARNIV